MAEKKFERYLVFAWYLYYPQGGWNDSVGSAPTQTAAQMMGERSIVNGVLDYDYAQIVDTENGDVWLASRADLKDGEGWNLKIGER